MKNILLKMLMLLMLAASMTGQAQAGEANSFVGLWERVETTDGSHDIISITGNGDGTFKVLQYATYFTVCNGGRGDWPRHGESFGRGDFNNGRFHRYLF